MDTDTDREMKWVADEAKARRLVRRRLQGKFVFDPGPSVFIRG
jgi:hypothetical protein